MIILVIESKPLIRKIISLRLEKLGHSVLVLDHIQDTIPFLNRYWPDVLLMNTSLENSTAMDFCTEIVDLFGELPPTLVHFATKNGPTSLAEHFPNISLIRSPFSNDELTAAIEQSVSLLTNADRQTG